LSAGQPRHLPWLEGYRKRTHYYISYHCPSVALQANRQTGGQAGGQQTAGSKHSTTGTRTVAVPSTVHCRSMSRPTCEHESTRGLQSQNPDRRGLRQLASGTQSLISPVAGTVPGTEFGRSSCEPCGQPETLAAGRLGRAPRGASPNAFSKTCHFRCQNGRACNGALAARWAFHRPLARQKC
jgi:hypothetical protein